MEITIVKPSEFGIEESKAGELMGNLPQIKEERLVLESQYSEILKLDIEDISTSKKARELRLKIKDNRTKGIDVWHKGAKDFFLKGGQFVDAIKRQEIAVNTRMEENLEQIEKHFETKEAERKSKLSAERVELLNPYSEFVPLGLNFGEISEDEFQKVFNGSKLQHKAKIESEKAEAKCIEAELRAEQERLAEEKRIHEEKSEAQRIENERLRGEAEAREKVMEAERIKQAEELAKQKRESDAKIKAEREAREKVEKEIRIKQEEEARIKKQRFEDEEKARKEAEKLAKAPVQKQLNTWVDSFIITGIGTDKMNESERKLANSIIEKFGLFKKWAKSEIENI